ncbi:phage protein [Staphylococcus aureus]|nr:phage protein [Staphylococcus aureus]CAC8030126.1 phage protein [Staphylococcus aureus]
MEQITLTKEELKEIIAKEVREAINGKKPISSGAIFNKVRISHKDFDEINKKFAYTERLRGADNLGLGHPLSLKKYQHGIGCYENYKAYASEIHDHIRKTYIISFWCNA